MFVQSIHDNEDKSITFDIDKCKCGFEVNSFLNVSIIMHMLMAFCNILDEAEAAYRRKR